MRRYTIPLVYCILYTCRLLKRSGRLETGVRGEEPVFTTIVSFLNTRDRTFHIITGFLAILAIGLVDFFTGYELGFSLFYLAPIVLLSWYTTPLIAMGGCGTCALAWVIADIGAGHQYSGVFIPYWNTVIRLGIFIVVAMTFMAFRRSIEREKQLSRIDFLTGAISSRFFREMLAAEVERSVRYDREFTIAYIDLDDFKAVNDNFGHDAGDWLLRQFVQIAKANLRKTDLVARLGGMSSRFCFQRRASLRQRSQSRRCGQRS